MSSASACRLPNGLALNIHPSHEDGLIATISLVKGLSESYCVGGTIRVFDPDFVAKEYHRNCWSLNSSEPISNKCVVRGLGKNFYFGTKDSSQNVSPLPVEMSIGVLGRRKGNYSIESANVFCPTLQCVASLALKAMPREFATPAMAEVAIPIIETERREWDKKIKQSEIDLPWIWHLGERLGWTDEELADQLSTKKWPLTVEAIRKLRKRNGFNSTPELLLRNAPEDDVPVAIARHLNEILEALRKPTVDDHHLHYLLHTIFATDDSFVLRIT